MVEEYDPANPNDVGKLVFHDDEGGLHVGGITVSDDIEADPVDVTLVPLEIVDEFEFIMVISPQVAWFFGALQADTNGKQIDDRTLIGARIIWWLSVRFATEQWKGLMNDERAS